MKENHNHYFKPCPYDTLDVYRVISIFGVSDPCIQHALKKMLCSGVRGHKDQSKDIQDVIDTLERWKDMREEDDKITSSGVISPKVSLETPDIDSPVENWYPDDSGEWIEYDGSGQPVEDGVLVEVVVAVERDKRHYAALPCRAEVWEWNTHLLDDPDRDIVAYKVVSNDNT